MARYFDLVREEMRGKTLDREASWAKFFVVCSTAGTAAWLAVIATVGVI